MIDCTHRVRTRATDCYAFMHSEWVVVSGSCTGGWRLRVPPAIEAVPGNHRNAIPSLPTPPQPPTTWVVVLTCLKPAAYTKLSASLQRDCETPSSSASSAAAPLTSQSLVNLAYFHIPVCASLCRRVAVSLCLCVFRCLCLFVSLSLCLSVSLSLCVAVSSLCVSLCLCLCIYASMCPCIAASLCLCVSSSVSVSLCLCVTVSLCLGLSVSRSLGLLVSRSLGLSVSRSLDLVLLLHLYRIICHKRRLQLIWIWQKKMESKSFWMSRRVLELVKHQRWHACQH